MPDAGCGMRDAGCGMRDAEDGFQKITKREEFGRDQCSTGSKAISVAVFADFCEVELGGQFNGAIASGEGREPPGAWRSSRSDRTSP